MTDRIQGTSRARLEAVLNRQRPDRVPWSPSVEDSFIQGESRYWETLTVEERKTLQQTYRFPSVVPLPTDLSFVDPIIWRVIRDLDADVLAFAPTVRQVNEQVTLETHGGDDKTILTFHTPWGDLQEVVVAAGPAETVYKSRFAITEQADYEILSKIYENRKFIPYPESFERQEISLGDRGVSFVHGADQPLVALFRVRDPVQLVLDLNDDPVRMKALLDLIHARNLECYRQIAQGPGLAVWTGMAFITTQLISPKLLSRFVLPYLAEYAQILHAAGKRLICHMCGHVRRLLPLLREADIDGIECLALPPIGDTMLDDYWQVMGPRAILLAGVNASYLQHASQSELVTYVSEVLKRNRDYPFILRTADDIPFGTPWQNLVTVSQVVPTPV